MTELVAGTAVILPIFNNSDVRMVTSMLHLVGARVKIRALVYNNEDSTIMGYKVTGNSWTWILTEEDVSNGL